MDTSAHLSLQKTIFKMAPTLLLLTLLFLTGTTSSKCSEGGSTPWGSSSPDPSATVAPSTAENAGTTSAMDSGITSSEKLTESTTSATPGTHRSETPTDSSSASPVSDTSDVTSTESIKKRSAESAENDQDKMKGSTEQDELITETSSNIPLLPWVKLSRAVRQTEDDVIYSTSTEESGSLDDSSGGGPAETDSLGGGLSVGNSKEDLESAEDRFGFVYPYWPGRHYWRRRYWPYYERRFYPDYPRYPIFPGR